MSRPCALAIVIVVLLLANPGRPASAQLNCDPGVEFYPGGALRRCTLNGHHRLHTARAQALTCASGHPAVLYEDGRLRSCVLAQPLASGAERCEAGSRVELERDGTLARCEGGPAAADDEGWHYILGQGRTAQQASLCRHHDVVLDLARAFRQKGPRAGYAALNAARGCETRVESFTPRDVLATVTIQTGDGGSYTVRFVEVTTATGVTEYLVTTRDVRAPTSPAP